MQINELRAKMKIELAAIESGEVRLGVYDQHYPYVLESALEQLTEENLAALHDKWGPQVTNASVNTYAHALSEFEAEEIASAWID